MNRRKTVEARNTEAWKWLGGIGFFPGAQTGRVVFDKDDKSGHVCHVLCAFLRIAFFLLLSSSLLDIMWSLFNERNGGIGYIIFDEEMRIAGTI